MFAAIATDLLAGHLSPGGFEQIMGHLFLRFVEAKPGYTKRESELMQYCSDFTYYGENAVADVRRNVTDYLNMCPPNQ